MSNIANMSTTTVTMTETNSAPAIRTEEELLSFVEGLDTKPLWKQMTRLNPVLPNPTTVPHIWRYDSIRPSLLRAGELVPEEQAERRVLMLVNPARGWYSINVLLTLFVSQQLT